MERHRDAGMTGKARTASFRRAAAARASLVVGFTAILALGPGAASGSASDPDPDSLGHPTLPILQRYGLLRLNIEPAEAETIVDGEYVDRNVWLISMRPGTHTLFVRKPGFKDYRKNFEISDGDRLTFDIRLEAYAQD